MTAAIQPPPALSPPDLERFGRLVERRYGLHFPENRLAELERGVLQAFAASTCQDLDSFYERLAPGPLPKMPGTGAGGADWSPLPKMPGTGAGTADWSPPGTSSLEMDRLVNALTVGETYFLRDAGQFNALFEHVLPEIVERRRMVRTLRIWSAGCASGEEPYSVAMMLRELLPDVEDWAITILGTDVNTEALARARQATYGEWAFREERARAWRTRYFSPAGRGTPVRWVLAPEVQRMVTFRPLNLAGSEYPSFDTNTTLMDLILCRNVTIYFSERATRHVIGRLYEALVDGGWLVVGHAEPSPAAKHDFRPRSFPGAVLYQRRGTTVSAQRGLAEPAARGATAPVHRRPEDRGALQPPLQEAKPQRAGPAASYIQPAPAVGKAGDTGPRYLGDTGPRYLGDTGPRYLGDASTATPVLAAGGEGKDGQDPIAHARELLEYGHSERARDLLMELVQEMEERKGGGTGTAAKRAARVYSLLGQAAANLADWPAAETWCRRAIEQDRLRLDAYYTLALVLQHRGRVEEAIDAMKKVVYIDRHDVLGHFGLAGLYHERGMGAPARKALENARRLLEAQPANRIIPNSGGVTVGRLHEAVVRQQQQWSEAKGPARTSMGTGTG